MIVYETPLKHLAAAGDELAWAERLGDVVVCAGAQPRDTR